MKALYEASKPQGYGVSSSIPADDWDGQWLLSDAFPYADWWGIMAYDFTYLFIFNWRLNFFIVDFGQVRP